MTIMEADGLRAIERREGQLWLLAFFFIFLLAVGVFVMDSADDLRLPAGPLEALLSNWAMRSALLVVVLLICAYFRERVKMLQRANRTLLDQVRQDQRHLDERARLLGRWGEMSHALITNSNQDELLELVVHTAIEFIDGDTASLMLLDEGKGELRIAAACGLPQEIIASTRIPVGEGVAGFVAQEGEPLLLTSDGADPRVAPQLRRGEEIRSAICVPLIVEGQVVGTLNVNRTRTVQDFDRTDLNTLSLFATQAVLAIEKARLYAAGQQQVETLRHMLAELERAQAQLIQSEKLASLGLLAGGVAHEINNPLMVILGRAELLLQDLAAEAPAARDLDTIRRETVRIADIVRNLLRFSREGHDGAVGPVDVNRAVEAVVSMTRQILSVDSVVIDTDLGPDLPPVSGNSGQLQQVFTNIAINAFHAMPGGGKLFIRTTHRGGEISVSFTDTGFGIPPEHLGNIFDPFFTTKREGKGTGLGLTVSYGIIRAHHGDIRVESEPGKGTCFTVILPAHAGAEALPQQVSQGGITTHEPPPHPGG
ncbi:MAG TPA: ATP-binding protein [Armatimonadota bacterium]|nr:ATP-binding protein [Armatimonadota bacterium]